MNRIYREEAEARPDGYIYAFWHGRQTFLIYVHRGNRIRPLISQSHDGDMVAHLCHSFNINPFRGSSSRGGFKALLGMKEELEAGGRIAISPDGPRGPLRQVQMGILYLAQKAGAPIIPLAFGARKRWVFGSWDEFLVPKPFNRLAVSYGEPLVISPTDNLERRAIDLKVALDAVSREADSVSGGLPCG